MTRIFARAFLMTTMALAAAAAVALAAPEAGKWKGENSQNRPFRFTVTDDAVVKDIVFEHRANCTSTAGKKWHPEFESTSYKSTKEKVKNGEIDIVRDLPEQHYELHGKFKKGGKATGRIEWTFWTKANGKFAYKKKDRVWTCKSNFDWSVSAPSS
jgi:hypothetical protein